MPETRVITSYSYWALFNLFYKCPFSFHLGAELGIKPKIRKFIERPIIEGAVFHSIMELKVKGGYEWRNLGHLIELAFKNIKERDDLEFSKRRETQVRREMIRLFLMLLRGGFRPYLEKIKEAEKVVKGEYKGMELKGRIDAVGEITLEDGSDVSYKIDFKLNAAESSSAGRQLAFYDLIYPTKEAYVFYPKMNLAKKVLLSPKRLDKLGEKVLELVEKIKSGDRSKKLTSCGYCAYKEVCVGR